MLLLGRPGTGKTGLVRTVFKKSRSTSFLILASSSNLKYFRVAVSYFLYRFAFLL